MVSKPFRGLVLAVILGMAIVILAYSLAVPTGQAQRQDAVVLAEPLSPSTGRAGELMTLPAPLTDQALLDLSGSDVTSSDCYREDKSQFLCFTVNNGSTSGEWIDEVHLTFPTLDGNWQVTCSSAYLDPADSMGYPVSFSCATPAVNHIAFQDSDADGVGEISNGASWDVCVDVTVPAGYEGPRFVVWELFGDGGASVNGTIEMEKCTPLTLKPSQVNIEGCNGMAQTLEFSLVNYGAGSATVEFFYNAPHAGFGGPMNDHLGVGESITFTTEFEPELCLDTGTVVTGHLIVEGNGHMDESWVVMTVTESAGWQRREDSPDPAMDNVVVWASHRDGGLWSIGGYGADGATHRYDPASGVWQTLQSEAVITPLIEYPMDGCYGLDGLDPDTAHEIVVLFPDTILTDTLHVYDITANTWYKRPIPLFFPPDYEGRWGYDVVSLQNNPVVQTGIPDRNVCYLSGGSTQQGGGRTKDLWLYNPATNDGQYVGSYAGSVWFGFHASWYVPWIGDDGAICVAGGADHNHVINDTTQCYDIGANAFHAPNADLGTLPEPWWGMADGWQITEHGYELWLANGVAADGTLLPASAFIREGMPDFAYGPEIPEGMYRLEGDGWEGQFLTLNGSRGGFWSSNFSLHLVPCPVCNQLALPVTLRAH